MSGTASTSQQEIGAAALALLEQALDLLDQLDWPVESAALVDLAMHRLRDALAAVAAQNAASRQAE